MDSVQPTGDSSAIQPEEEGGPRTWLNAEDIGGLQRWRDALILQNGHRGEHKGILKLVVKAMTDREFRTRLVNDTDAVIAAFKAQGWNYPENVQLNFYENSPDTMNIVLPTLAGTLRSYPPAVRDVLRSGTAYNAIGRDDWDFGDIGDNNNHGDHLAQDGGTGYG
jgi:hypothetical protein